MVNRILSIFVTCSLLARSNYLAAESGAAPPPTPPADALSMLDPPRHGLRTASGLIMLVLQKGRGKDRPKPNDCVTVSFTTWTVNGAVFKRSQPDGSGSTQCIRRLTQGISEAVSNMVIGEKRRIWVPARLSTSPGASDDDGPLPAVPDLIYELTLVDIIRAPPTPIPLRAAPTDAIKLTAGLAMKLLARGTGEAHPASTQRVKIHLSGWTLSGALFESTVMAGHPATYPLSNLIAGLREGVGQLVVGDRARFWIPAKLAYGIKPHRRGQPAGALVYDVELLAIE